MKRLALIGTGDFAHQIRGFAEKYGVYQVVGYFDDFRTVGEIDEGLPILGKIDDAEVFYQNKLFDYLFIAVGYLHFSFRCSVFERFKGKVPFANIISPNVDFQRNVKLGEGIFIGTPSSIGEGTVIGDNVFMRACTVIGHDNEIGAHTYISGRVDTAGFVKIGQRNFIGIRVLVADHISVCDDVWIGLGCIVAKNITNPGKYMTSAAKLYKIE